MKELNFFSGSTGLNTRVDPTRVDYDPKTGVSDMVEGVNITIDDSLRPQRRSGFSLAQAGDYHSLFCDGGDCFVAMDTALYRVGTDLSLTGMRSGMAGTRIAFCQVNDETYYCNGTDNGVIREGISFMWPTQDYTGPETTRQFEGAPVGNHLAFHLGRIFISVDNVLWWSEPFNFGLFDRVRNFVQFPSYIRMVKPVRDGLFVSDLQSTYFLRGNNPKEFVMEKVSTTPAYEWSEAIDYVEADEIGDFNISGLCAVWASPEGAVLGLPNGQTIKLNKNKMAYPTGLRQGAGLLDGFHFVHTIF